MDGGDDLPNGAGYDPRDGRTRSGGHNTDKVIIELILEVILAALSI